MITVGESVVLGVVQGLTEFLPVSSDGHLALVHRFITPLKPEEILAVDVALHAGTLVAVVAYFRHDLWSMLLALGSPRTSGWRFRWIGLLALACVPVAVVAIPVKKLVEESFASPPIIGVCFLVTGAFLFLASAVRGALRTEEDVDARDALLIGTLQVLAILPGLSRSATTISGGLFRRLRPDVSARFSFLLGIPAIVGAELVEARELSALGPEAHVPLAVGIVMAAVTGLAAIWVLLRLLQTGRLHYFAYYTWALGALVLLGAAVGGL